MTKQAKATVIVILGLGIFASVATLIRLKFLSDLEDLADILCMKKSLFYMCAKLTLIQIPAPTPWYGRSLSPALQSLPQVWPPFDRSCAACVFAASSLPTTPPPMAITAHGLPLAGRGPEPGPYRSKRSRSKTSTPRNRQLSYRHQRLRHQSMLSASTN